MISLSSPEHTLYLPNPETGDTENLQSTIEIKLALDGTRRTYVRSNPDRLLSYTFRLTRAKALELEVFIENNHSKVFRLHNHKGEDWDVQFITNPFDFVDPGPNETTINLQFQGEQV